MAPVLLTRSRIDDQRWNELIGQSQQQIIYGYSWYLDIVCEDWNALVWPSTDNFQIVMPLPIRKKWNFSVIQQPLFCQFLGIFSQNELTVQQVTDFLTAFSSNFSYVSTYSFNPQNYPLIQTVISQFAQLKFTENHTFWLSLNNSFETIHSKYSKSRRLNLAKARKHDWILKLSDDILPMVNLFKNYHESLIEGGVSNQAYLLLARLTEELLTRKCAEIWYLSLENEIHAGALFVQKNKTAVYLFNAADKTGSKQNARTYLLDQYFKKHAENDLCFDFESPEIASISKFYKSFGGEIKPFFEIQKNDLPFPLKQIQKFRKKLLLKPYKIFT